MSKLYPAYLSIKKLDSSTILLFKSGMFYILLENDARIVSSILKLKLSNLNPEVVKCSFHVNSLDKYLPILVKNKLDIKIVDLCNIKDNNIRLSNIKSGYNTNIYSLLLDLSKLDMSNMSVKDAYFKLDDFNKKANIILRDTLEHSYNLNI
jgi:DNA mismatch repair ATPase MutS